MLEKLSTEEFLYFTNILSIHHSIFYKFWSIGRPYYSEDIPTAAIIFDREGDEVQFVLNKEFWNTLSDNQKAFVICHECMHIIWDHGKRFKNNVNTDLANIAMDICINHALVNNFGFNRKEIDPENNYCWIDTVFKNSKDIATDKSFEYYYNKLLTSENNVDSVSLIDDHSHLSGEIGDALPSESNSENILERLSDFDEIAADQIKEFQHNEETAGKIDGSASMTVKVNVPTKKKWEIVIKNWVKKSLQKDYVDQDHWLNCNRRFALLDDDLMLPSVMEIENPKNVNNKIDVWFFQDTSGSCVHLAKRFFSAAKSLPPEKFNVKLFCFDTRVYETSLESGKLYGFGGTSFHIIESYIQNKISKENIEYPDSVWVITDGYGDDVYPKFPEKWFWFLSENYRECIPKASHVYKLSDFE